MLLGIDLGTGSAKALLMTVDGTVIGEASSSYPVNAPHLGCTESEPADWWEGVAFSLRQGLEAIAAIGGRRDDRLCTRCCKNCRHLLS